MAKDNLVHPYYNHAYARYDLDIEDIILGLKKAGYILDDDSNGNFVDWMENNTSDWSVGSLSTTFTVGSNVKYLRVCGVSDGTRVTGALNKIS